MSSTMVAVHVLVEQLANQASTHARTAISLDQCGQSKDAVPYYLRAVHFLLVALSSLTEQSSPAPPGYYKSVDDYLKRVDAIGQWVDLSHDLDRLSRSASAEATAFASEVSQRQHHTQKQQEHCPHYTGAVTTTALTSANLHKDNASQDDVLLRARLSRLHTASSSSNMLRHTNGDVNASQSNNRHHNDGKTSSPDDPRSILERMSALRKAASNAVELDGKTDDESLAQRLRRLKGETIGSGSVQDAAHIEVTNARLAALGIDPEVLDESDDAIGSSNTNSHSNYHHHSGDNTRAMIDGHDNNRNNNNININVNNDMHDPPEEHHLDREAELFDKVFGGTSSGTTSFIGNDGDVLEGDADNELKKLIAVVNMEQKLASRVSATRQEQRLMKLGVNPEHAVEEIQNTALMGDEGNEGISENSMGIIDKAMGDDDATSRDGTSQRKSEPSGSIELDIQATMNAMLRGEDVDILDGGHASDTATTDGGASPVSLLKYLRGVSQKSLGLGFAPPVDTIATVNSQASAPSHYHNDTGDKLARELENGELSKKDMRRLDKEAQSLLREAGTILPPPDSELDHDAGDIQDVNDGCLNKHQDDASSKVEAGLARVLKESRDLLERLPERDGGNKKPSSDIADSDSDEDKSGESSDEEDDDNSDNTSAYDSD